MCTVAFLPSPGGGYILGHNRDESRRRARGAPPGRFLRRGRRFIAPRDPQGGGTWIGVNDAGVTMCLLNAEEASPSRLPAAPSSRGRVLWEMLHLGSLGDVGAKLRENVARLRETRAFHLVVALPDPTGGSGANAASFRWDGSRLNEMDHEGPAVFVSSGYDMRGAIRERGKRWTAFLAHLRRRSQTDSSDLAEEMGRWLMSHEPERGALSVCMHREAAATVSRTLVFCDSSEVRFDYHDGAPCDADAPRMKRSLALA